MDLHFIQERIEQLRKTVIGAPHWVETKQTFEYTQHSIEVVVVLKLVRAAQGLSAIKILCEFGLFVDLGAAIRATNDCVEEIYFLLESYPEAPSNNVERFITAFFEGTVDSYLSISRPPLARDKIRSAVVRILKGSHDDSTQKMLEKIYRTFCGYVHADYAHIMEIYNGGTDDFNLGGVLSIRRRKEWLEHVELAANSVLMAATFTAYKLGYGEIGATMAQAVE